MKKVLHDVSECRVGVSNMDAKNLFSRHSLGAQTVHIMVAC
jgi:hypothetical protein